MPISPATVAIRLDHAMREVEIANRGVGNMDAHVIDLRARVDDAIRALSETSS